MLPYYIMLGVPLVIALLYGNESDKIENQKKQRFVMSVFFGILLLILVLRHKTVGTDIQTYLGMFRFTSKMSFEKILDFYDGEYGYYFLTKIISLITMEDQWFIVIMALLTTIPLAVLYVKKTENAALTIAVFMTLSNFSMLFSGIRQSIALAIIAASYYFIKNKKFLWLYWRSSSTNRRLLRFYCTRSII